MIIAHLICPIKSIPEKNHQFTVVMLLLREKLMYIQNNMNQTINKNQKFENISVLFHELNWNISHCLLNIKAKFAFEAEEISSISDIIPNILTYFQKKI